MSGLHGGWAAELSIAGVGTGALLLIIALVLVPVMCVIAVAGLVAVLHSDATRRNAARLVYREGLNHVRRLLRPDRQPGPPLVEQPVKSSSALVPAQRTQEPAGVTALCAHPTPASSTEPPEVTGEQVGHRRAVGCPQDKTSQP